MDESKKQKMQEAYMEFQMINSSQKQLEKQLQMITEQAGEMAATISGLEEFSKVKEDSEVLLPISSGMFAKAKIAKNDTLIVNVGAGVCVEKDIPSAKALIEEQIAQSEEIKTKIVAQMDKLEKKAKALEEQMQAFMPSE